MKISEIETKLLGMIHPKLHDDARELLAELRNPLADIVEAWDNYWVINDGDDCDIDTFTKARDKLESSTEEARKIILN